MRITRRRAVGLIGSTVAFPYVLRTDRAAAAVRLRRLGPPRQLGGALPGAKSSVALSAFPNGNFIAGFLNDRGSGDRRAYIQYFDSSASPLSGFIQMGGATGPTDGKPALSVAPVAKPDGSALIFFSAERNGAPLVDRYDIFAQRLSPARQKVGDPFVINTKTTGRQGEGALFAERLSSGKIMATWLDQGVTLDSYNIRDRIIGPAGAPVSIERQATASAAGMQIPRDLAPLAGGGSVLSYTTFLPSTNHWKSEVQQFNASGVRVGNPIVIKNYDGAPFGSVGVASMPVGPISTWWHAWYAKDTDTTADLMLQQVKNGVPVQPVLIANNVRIDFWIDNPPGPPGISVFHDNSVGDMALLTYYTLAANGARQLDALAASLPAGNVLAGPTMIRTAPSGHHSLAEASIRILQNIFAEGFSESDGNPQNSKAYVQRIEWFFDK
jgi:hypothetical protein